MQSLTVCVTGGTGFFGHNLVKLLQQDPRVQCIHVLARHDPPTELAIKWGREYFAGTYVTDSRSRPPSPPSLTDLQSPVEWEMPNAVFENTDKITVFRGNVCDPVALDSAMAGCQVVFHVCGDTRWWNAVRHDQYDTNVNGTVHVLQCAKRTPSVRRIIVTGTVDVMGHHEDKDVECDELHDMDQYSFKGFGYWYADTKRQAEEYVLKFQAGERDQALIDPDYEIKQCTVVRASSMVGPWDVTLQYGRIFVQIRNEAVEVIPPGGLSVCHVDDVARLHMTLAFTHGRPLPAVVIAAGHYVTYRELYYDIRDEICKQTKWTPHYRTIGFRCMEVIPRWALVSYGYAAELWSNVWSGLHPEVNPGMARYLCCETRYSSRRAQNGWDYPVDLAQRYRDALRDCCAWLVQRKKI